ncbi:MAG: acetyltransferase [Lentimicrobiaceae bacterium]|nr:acetyltransferase [Lentimicrobiaceae bacterium]
MTEVIIVGSGGHGAELDEYISYANHLNADVKLKVIGFLDDNPANYASYSLSAPLLGGVRDHAVRKDCQYIMGIANLLYRKRFVEQYQAQGAIFARLIHPAAYLSPSATVGEGVVIGPMANIGPNVKIGDFTLINSRCSLGHDTHLGKYNFISPNVCFSGFTSIGDENLFGINSATIPTIKVGNRNKIAAGMVLDKNVGDDTVVFYRFKEKVIAVPQ